MNFQKEILTALRQLGEKLNAEEIKFLEKENLAERDRHFEKVSEDSGTLLNNLNYPIDFSFTIFFFR